MSNPRIETPKILPETNMSRHIKSYRESDFSVGGKMSGKMIEKALNQFRRKYAVSTKEERSILLDSFCDVTGYHRKYAISLLRKPIKTSPKKKHARENHYSHKALLAIEQIWIAADFPWSQRLKALLPLWLPWAKKRMQWITSSIEDEILSISARQIDRRLKSKKMSLSRKMYGRTKPGTLLKHHIPIKTDSWDVTQPGFTEIDLVSHSGSNASGEFIHSFNMTDIYSGWVESMPLMGKSEFVTLAAIKVIRRDLPFPLLGIDSDNGSEFINHHLYKYCQKKHIQFTRGRPYKKNDNAHIEQKNWTHIRRIMGYHRFDSDQEYDMIFDLYRKKLRIMMNLFQPCVKLVSKERVGAKTKRRYDDAMPPLDRLLEYHRSSNLPLSDELNRLVSLRETTDPFQLSDDITKLIEKIKNAGTETAKKVNVYEKCE